MTPPSARAHRLLWTLLAGLIGASSCERCAPGREPSAPPPVERLVPKSAHGVVVTPSIERLVARVTELEGTRSVDWTGRWFGFGGGRGLVDLLFAQLGTDLRDLVALRRMGVATDRSLAFVLTASGAVVVLVPYVSHEQLQPALAELVGRRFGARHLTKEQRGRLWVHTFSSSPSATPVVAYGLVTGYALVAAGDGAAELAEIAELPREATLASEPLVAASNAQALGAADLWAFAPRGSPLLRGLHLGSTLVSASVTDDAITATADAEWTSGAASLALFRPLAPASIDWMLPEDTFLRVQISGDPAPVTSLLEPLFGTMLRKELRSDEAYEFVAGLPSKLRPGVSVGLMLNPKPVSQSLFQHDPRRENPFSFVHVLGSADARDADDVEPTLRRLTGFAPLYGRSVERLQRGELPVYFFDGKGGEVLHLAPQATRVYFGVPLERLEKLIERSTSTPPSIKPPVDGVRVHLDVAVLVKAARALPDSTFGIGGAAVKAVVLDLAAALSDFRTATLRARASGAQSAHAELVIERAPRPKSRAPGKPPKAPPPP